MFYPKELLIFISLHKMMAMVFNATFNNIAVMSWWSVLLVEEIGVPGEIHRSSASH
jgi:hypothetical protein